MQRDDPTQNRLQDFCQIHTDKHRKSKKMRRDKCMFQKKEQDKTPRENPSEAELSNLSDQEFKTSVIKNAHQTQMKRGTR